MSARLKRPATVLVAVAAATALAAAEPALGAAGAPAVDPAGPALGAAAPPAAHAARAPVVRQLVVFPRGGASERSVAARGVRVRLGRRRCVVGAGTPLAALVRAWPARVRLRDFGACSNRARDAAGLFVSAIGRWPNRRRDGWVYKLGAYAATAGAADPAGPFGRGRLRSRQRLLWFYCRLERGGCQRSLALRVRREAGGVAVVAFGYDDEGARVRVGGATIWDGRRRAATTGPDGGARLELAPGRHRLHAGKRGLVRSFTETVVIR